jgi:uncharacterized membrane protein
MRHIASGGIGRVSLLRGENVSRIERWGSVAGGALLLAYGIKQWRSGSSPWLNMSAAALPLLYRGITGHCPVYAAMGVSTASRSTRVALAGRKGITVRESIRIHRPVDELYQLWRRFENLPRFMSNLLSVTEAADGRSHWVAGGPAGQTVEWDAEIINEVPNKVIGWRSLPNADVVSAGSVNFEPVRDRRSTQLTVHLQYAAPAGRLGATVAMLFGREPSQMIREDLHRLKEQLEAGEGYSSSLM